MGGAGAVLALCLLVGRAAGARVASSTNPDAQVARRGEASEARVKATGAGEPCELPGIVADVRLALRPGRNSADERDALDAMRRAELALSRGCGAPTEQRQSLGTLARLCRGVVGGAYGVDLRTKALNTLGWLAGASDSEHLPSIVESCARALESKDVAARHILHALEAVGQNEASDAATLDLVITLAGQLVRLPEAKEALVDDWQDATPNDVFREDTRARYIFNLMSIVLRFAPRAAADPGASRSLASLTLFVIESTHGSVGYLSVHLLVLDLLRQVLPLVDDEIAIADMLRVVELCSGGEWVIVNHMAAEALHALSTKVGSVDLERVVELSVRGELAPQAGARNALDIVQQRLIAEFQGSSAARLGLLARVLAIEERRRRFVSCNSALALLQELRPPEPLSHEALRGLLRHGFAPPVEVAMYIDEFLPMSAEEEARSRIVEVCARTATGRVSRAWLLLQAACTQPRRVGLRVVRAVAELLDAGDGLLAKEFLRSSAFSSVGLCLTDGVRRDGMWMSDSTSEYLRGFDAAIVQRIASELLDIAVALDSGRRWPQSIRRLCDATGNLHRLCGSAASVVA